MKQLASGKHMKNDCFPRTLKFEMQMWKQNGNIALPVVYLLYAMREWSSMQVY
jgi:hypothetical protein